MRFFYSKIVSIRFPRAGANLEVIFNETRVRYVQLTRTRDFRKLILNGDCYDSKIGLFNCFERGTQYPNIQMSNIYPYSNKKLQHNCSADVWAS